MEVEFFDTMEEAMARLEEARIAADSRVKPWQATIAPGDCFLSVVEDGLVVFGEVLEGYQDERLQHYRFCRCYSVACPEGELGDVHVLTIACLISRGFFEKMQKAGWAMEGPAASPAIAGERVGRRAGLAGSPGFGMGQAFLKQLFGEMGAPLFGFWLELALGGELATSTRFTIDGVLSPASHRATAKIANALDG